MAKCSCDVMDLDDCHCEYWEKDEIHMDAYIGILPDDDIPPWEDLPEEEDISWDEETSPGWDYEDGDEESDTPMEKL